MSDFERIYGVNVGDAEDINHDRLKPLMSDVFRSLTCREYSRKKVLGSLIDLIEFLTTSEGSTPSTLWAVDMFFSDYDGKWDEVFERIDGDLMEIMNEFGFLHGSIDQPDIHTSPAQLKKMIAKIAK